MKKQHLLGALLVVVLIASFTTAYGATWYRLREWAERHTTYDHYTCFVFPNSHAPYQRIRLKPITGDPDLYVYGYSSGVWYPLAYSTHLGLQPEIVAVPSGIVSRFQACVYAYGSPGSYYSLFYEGGY